MFNRALVLIAAAFFSFTTFAAPADEAFEGNEYAVLKTPHAVATGKKIEVLEFFWYRCPHCFHLEPGLEKWLKTLPGDAQIRRVPAVFRPDWMPGAKLYYTLEQMGLLERLHGKVFNAYHVQNLDLNNPAVLGDWIAKQGVDRKKFESVYNSFSTQSRAMQGGKLASEYSINGVPAFIIDGKYTSTVSMTGSEARLFEVLDQLIARARTERKGRPTR